MLRNFSVSFLLLFGIQIHGFTATAIASAPSKKLGELQPHNVIELNEKLKIYHYILENGLEVFLRPNPQAPNVQVAHWVKAGSLHEKKGSTGIAHLFEHMMFRPLKMGEPSFSQKADKLGALLNANTRFESTYYHTSVPAKNLKQLLLLESDRFRNLKVTDGLLDLERGAVWSEYSTKFDSNPILDLWFEVYRKAFPGHPFGWTIIGEREDLTKIKAADCNEFFSKYYVPNNIGLFITGDFKLEEALKEVIDDYSTWTKGASVELPKAFNQKTQKIIAKGKLPSENNNILFGFRVPYLNKDNIQEFTLLNYILFASPYSLFNQRLVEDQKIAANVQDWGLDYDNGMVKSLIMALPTTTLSQIETNVAEISKDFEKMNQQEFDAYKQNYYIELAEALQRNDDLADRLALFWGKYHSITLLKDLASHPMTLSKEQIKDYISAYFKNDNFVYISNPKPPKK